MSVKIFISYASQNENKVRALKIALKQEGFEPIVVADRKSPGMLLAEKVKEGIDEATFFVPILTRDSISNQWVNQEIGFAEAKEVSILPVVEQQIIPKLKGFIHNQVDLSLFYKGSNDQPRKEAASFRRCYRKLIDLLLNTESDTFTSTISPKRVREGETYTTTVHFRGKVRNGFFDNKVVHMDRQFITWNWDNETLADEKPTTPGKLNGKVDVRREYSHSTKGWTKGKYKINVGLWSHHTPGEAGRSQVVHQTHELEVI